MGKPGIRNILWPKIKTIRFENVQAENSIINIIIARHETNIVSGRLRPARIQLTLSESRVQEWEIIIKRISMSSFKIVANCCAIPPLDGFAQGTTSTAS